MTEEPDNLVLVYLRRLEAGQGKIREDLTELKTRLSELTQLVVSQGRAQVGLHETNARIDARLDRYESRLERVERRLDIVD